MSKKLLFRIVFLLLGIWFILLSIIYFSGNKYEDHVLKLLQKQLGDRLSTEIQLPKNGIHFSVLRNFPNASLQLNNILIKSSPELNREDFDFIAIDTLLFAEELSLLFNLKGILSKKYELRKIVISHAKINLLNDRAGNNNFKVIKSRQPAENSDSVEIQLRNIHLNDIKIHYIDAKQRLHLSGFTNNSELSGEFMEENFSIQIEASLQNFDLIFGGKNYLNNSPAKLSLNIMKSDSTYYFEKGQVNNMGINMTVQGIFNQRNNYYKFITQSKEAALSKISFPALNRFLSEQKIEIEKGSLDMKTEFAGYAKHNGTSISSNFIIQKAGLISQGKNLRIKNIFLQGNYFRNSKGISDITFDTLSMFSDKSQISGACSLQNLSRPLMKGKIRGILELQKIMLFESVAQRFELDGIIEGELIINGTVSTAKDSWRKDFTNAFRSGKVEIINGYIRPLMNPLPAAFVNGIVRLKGMRNIWFEDMELEIGESDLLISGSLTDLPVFSGDKSIFPVYRCKVISKELHVEDFLLEEKQENTGSDQTVQLPDSMIVIAQIQVGEFYFGKFSANNSIGTIHYRPKILTISDFSMESQHGKIFSEIIISQENNRLITKSQANFQKVDLGDMFYAFNNFGQNVISTENLDGALTGSAIVHADWDINLKPFLKDLKLESSFIIENGELIDYHPLLGLSKFIEVDELRHIEFDKLETSIRIDKEVVYISETNINSSAISLTASGEHDFENRYRYNMQVQLSDILWNKAKKRKPQNTEFGYVVDDGLGKTTIPLVIEGKDKEFEVYYDKEKGRNTFRTKVKQERKDFSKLLKSDGVEEQNEVEQEVRLEWDDDTPNSDQTKTESNNQNQEQDEEDQEFIIEWEDD